MPENEAKLIFWEIITVIHTFAGTLLIESLSESKLNSNLGLLFVGGISLFIANLIAIGYTYDWKRKNFRIDNNILNPKNRFRLIEIKFFNLLICLINFASRKNFGKISYEKETNIKIEYLQITFWLSVITVFVLIIIKILG